MNYLAHIFLSGTDPKMQIGNFIGDAVKGNSYNNYPNPIRDGILLHRAIDEFTDNYPTIKAVIPSLRPYFGPYSAVLLDIYFDYLLASRFDEFSNMSLKRFTRGFYWSIARNYRYLPASMKQFMWHFIGTNRLLKYSTPNGIHRSLEIMVHIGRIKIPLEKEALDYLIEQESELWSVFYPLFTELQSLCNGYIEAEDREKYLETNF